MTRGGWRAGEFVVRGRVEHGDERGRTLGFPTANLAIEGVDIPDGVWAGWLQREAITERLPSAISVGSRPTFYGREGIRLVEAFVLDFAGDLYGEVVTVTLAHALRPQRRFRGVSPLVEQLNHDVAATRSWCATATFEPLVSDIAIGRGVVLTSR